MPVVYLMIFWSPEEMRMCVLLFLAMLTAVLIACTAQAYVPSTQFIFNRATAQHGKGDFLVEDEVTFHEGSDTLAVRESWIVVDGGEMRVSALTDTGAKIFKILRKGRTYWLEENGSERSEEVQPGQYMRILLTRSSVELRKLFVNWGVLPAEVLRDKKLPKEAKDIVYEPETFARLARVAGTTAYAYGTPAPVDGPAPAGLWIEQDAFNIRKVRTPDGADMQFNDYATYSKNLIFPRSHNIIFGNHIVNVRVTKVSSINLTGDSRRQLEPSWLRGHSDAITRWPKTTMAPVVQEFYKRFR